MDMFPSFLNISSFGTIPMIVATLGLLIVAAGVWYGYRTFFAGAKSKSGASSAALPEPDFVSGAAAERDGPVGPSETVGPGQIRQGSESAYYQESSSYQQLPPNLPVPPGPVYSEQQPQMSGAPVESA